MERHHHPNDSNLFAKTVCTICFEGLNPVIEDLQTISICGHVFHELCLQQRLESCPSGKKKNACPVCKQKFSQKNFHRLYFQLIGEPISSPGTSPPSDAYQDSVLVLRGELGKLGEKLASVNRAHEQQQQHLRELMKELSIANDRAVKEEATKVEVLRENAALHQTLKKKTEDLAQSNAERSKLQEKILALEKDLAAHKLASNLDLDEAEITRLVGHAKDSENVIDTLRKSLILRNWSYKELMAQCDLLGREKQSSQKKLAKAVKKMGKLKERLKKLERAVEDKDNEILRNLKEPKRVRVEEADEYGVKLRFNNLNNCKTTVKKESVDVSPDSCCTHFLPNHSSANANGDLSKEQKASNLKILKREIIDVDMEEAEIPTKMDTEGHSPVRLEKQRTDLKNQMQLHYLKNPEQLAAVERTAPHMDMLEEIIEDRKPILVEPLDLSHTDFQKHSKSDSLLITLDDDFMSTGMDKATAHCNSIASPGEHCYPGGLLGSEVVSGSVGKWPRQRQTVLKKPFGMEQLIAVTADRKGGHDQSLDGGVLYLWTKPSKKVHKRSKAKQTVSWLHIN